MIRLDLLPKILYRPREAFEELRGDANGKDGLLLYVSIAILSLMMAIGVSQATKISLMPLDFGFGAVLTAGTASAVFFVEIVHFGLLAAFSNFFALKMGGDGNFSNMLGMFGYARVLFLIKAIVSALIVAWIYTAGIFAATRAIQGNLAPPNLFLIGAVVLLANLVLGIWSIGLYIAATSKAHNISLAKSFVSVIISAVVLGFMVYGLALLLVRGAA
ncbi:MAG: YIP1 family protein [archaeon]